MTLSNRTNVCFELEIDTVLEAIATQVVPRTYGAPRKVVIRGTAKSGHDERSTEDLHQMGQLA